MSVARTRLPGKEDTMPVTLDTPFSPGSYDPGKTYDKIKVVNFTLDLYRYEIRVTVGHGYEDSGSWIWARDPSGSILSTSHTISDIPEIPPDLDEFGDPIPDTGAPADPQFSALVSTMGDAAKTVYDKAAEEIYAWIIANLPEHEGTIDE